MPRLFTELPSFHPYSSTSHLLPWPRLPSLQVRLCLRQSEGFGMSLCDASLERADASEDGVQVGARLLDQLRGRQDVLAGCLEGCAGWDLGIELNGQMR
jgi:hypothetical protein